MASKYEGTSLESAAKQIERRRELNKALMAQALAPSKGTQMVGDRAIYDPWSGIAKVGKAVMGAYGNKKADKDEEELGERYRKNREESVLQVQEALSKKDYQEASMLLGTDPFLKGSGSDLAKVVMARGGPTANKQTYTYMPTAGGLARLPGRPGEEPSMATLQGQPIIPSGQDPKVIADRARAREAASQQMKTQYAPGREAKIAEAKAGVELSTAPDIAAATERAKLTAKAETGREMTAEGIGSLVTQAQEILSGDIPPTASGIGSMIDSVAAIFGQSPSGSAKAAQLEVIGGALMTKTPRFEGPQGVLDVQIYKQMAGKVGDRSIPIEERLAALETVRTVLGKHEKNKSISDMTDEEILQELAQ